MTERMAKATYDKPRPRKDGPFRTAELQSNKLVVDKDHAPNTMLINRIISASSRKSNIRATQWWVAQQSKDSQETQDTWEQQTDKASRDVARKANQQTEYAAERIVGRKGYSQKRRHTDRWYGYGPKDGRLGTAQNILQNLVECYRKRDCKKKRMLRWAVKIRSS